MILKTSFSVKTAPPAATFPWSCVWRNRDGLRCHIGRVYDPELFAKGAAEYSQESFPSKKPSTMTLIGGSVVTRAPNPNMSKSTTTGFKTGSVEVYYKTNFGRANYDSNTLQLVPESGYAYWPEGAFKSSSGSVYVILSRLEKTGEKPKWAISLCLEAAVQKNDFKLACIAGSSCIQIWQSDITYAAGGSVSNEHPWKVSFKLENNGANVSIVNGSINNVMLSNPEYVHPITQAGEYSVLLKVTCVGLVYPSEIIWSVVKDWPSFTLNTISEAWVKVAHVKVTSGGTPPGLQGTVTQLISSSMMSERLRYGTSLNSARYYFNRV
jgi:hypothetical protein